MCPDYKRHDAKITTPAKCSKLCIEWGGCKFGFAFSSYYAGGKGSSYCDFCLSNQTKLFSKCDVYRLKGNIYIWIQVQTDFIYIQYEFNGQNYNLINTFIWISRIMCARKGHKSLAHKDINESCIHKNNLKGWFFLQKSYCITFYSASK